MGSPSSQHAHTTVTPYTCHHRGTCHRSRPRPPVRLPVTGVRDYCPIVRRASLPLMALPLLAGAISAAAPAPGPFSNVVLRRTRLSCGVQPHTCSHAGGALRPCPVYAVASGGVCLAIRGVQFRSAPPSLPRTSKLHGPLWASLRSALRACTYPFIQCRRTPSLVGIGLPGPPAAGQDRLCASA
jgi:hypothetical protein